MGSAKDRVEDNFPAYVIKANRSDSAHRRFKRIHYWKEWSGIFYKTTIEGVLEHIEIHFPLRMNGGTTFAIFEKASVESGWKFVHQIMDIAKFESLSPDEKFIVEWQSGMLGHFRTALIEAIGRADEGNLEKLARGFPHEVAGYLKFTREDGWWQGVEKKL